MTIAQLLGPLPKESDSQNHMRILLKQADEKEKFGKMS